MSSVNNLLNNALNHDNRCRGTAAPEGGTSTKGLEGMPYVATLEAKTQGKHGTSLGMQVIKGEFL
jgi:hypothetical protein